jgi:polar amino acid transport system substrate-binding protein
MRQFKPLGIATIALFALVVLSVPGKSLAQNILQEIAAASTLEEIKKRGSIRIGFSTFVPSAMLNQKGKLTGFEIAVGRKLAEDSGWKAEHIQVPWDGIIPGLIAGKFDAIIGGMSVYMKRNQTVNFTIPYDDSSIGIAAHTTLAKGFSTLKDFNKPGVTLVVRRGSSNIPWMKEAFPKAKQRYFDDDAQAFQEVMNGNAHAVVSAEPKPSLWTGANTDVLFQPFGKRTFIPRPSAMAVRKGDHDFLNYLNNWITIRTSDGWFAKTVHHWKGTTDWFPEIWEPGKSPFDKKS